jgi:hypothetical protein
MLKNSASVQFGDIIENSKIYFQLFNNWIANIIFHSTDNLKLLPDNIEVSYYDNIKPPGVSGVQTSSNCFWKITTSGGSNPSTDITFYYGASNLGNITSENNIRVSQSDNNGSWISYLTEGTGSGQYQLDVANKKITVYGLTSYNNIFTLTDVINPLPLSVNLLTFISVIIERDVNLSWSTEWEQNNKGFNIERKITTSSEWLNIGFVKGKGNSNTTQFYSFNDSKLSVGKYNYRLKQIDYNGNYEYFKLKDNVIIGIPNKFEISQNYPNPYNPTSKIDFEIPYDVFVSIKIYDVLGREIKTLVNEFKKAGYYSLNFNATSFASGTYFYKMVAGNYSQSKRMLYIK